MARAKVTDIKTAQAEFDARIAKLQTIIPAQFEAYAQRKSANGTISGNRQEIVDALKDEKIRTRLYELFTGEVLVWLKAMYTRITTKRATPLESLQKKVASMSDTELLAKRSMFLSELEVIETQLKAHGVKLVTPKLKVA